MSGDSDNIFARWSRRKQTVQDSERQAPPLPEQAGEDAAREVEQAPQVGAAGSEAAPPAVPLPRLEDITADSDLSAFLREGVPEALKRAALRKSWSLDEAIRNYIGPSENAWDFNTPGAVPGFGPLEAGKAVAEFLSKMGGGETAGPMEVAAAGASSAAPEENPGLSDAAAEPESATEEPPPDAPPASKKAPDSPDLAGDQAELAAGSEGEPPSARFTVRPRHGGAVPR
jgi:hypothetical protein